VFFDFTRLPPVLVNSGTVVNDPLCSECQQLLPVTKSGDMESAIYLHAWRYRLSMVRDGAVNNTHGIFETQLPRWAL
jgi:hypothetical protein